jgi:dipeptidyl aminopeptidase/acylaminoacyl peptidase
MQEVIFRNGNVVLAGSLYLPAGAGKFPAIVCNHSSGDKPRYDGAFMADYMAKKGIAVLIYDKRGNGQSTGDWRTSGFEDLADDCIAGVKLLKSMPKIDARRIGIFGHSQGATFSPIIVRRCADIAFNIAAAGFAVSPPEQDIFRVTNVLKHEARFNKKTTDSAIRFYKIWLEVARTGKGRANMMKEDSNVKNASWYKWVEPPPANSWPWKWYLKAGNYNYIPYWEKVKIPTLLIYGDKDEVTPVKASVTRIKAALKKAGNKQYTVVIMPNATHYFAGVKKEGDLWTQSVPGYLEDIYKWIPTNAQIRSRMK